MKDEQEEKDKDKKHIGSLNAPKKEELLKPHEELKLLTEKHEQRVADLENLLKRIHADFDNFRKQTEKEKQELSKQTNAILITKLLSVIDEFEISINQLKKQDEKEAIGIEMLYKNFMKVLNNEGLREMHSEDEVFDPYKHEAIKYEQSELEQGKIISTLKKGYVFHERILRHAKVIVSKGKDESKNEK